VDGVVAKRPNQRLRDTYAREPGEESKAEWTLRKEIKKHFKHTWIFIPRKQNCLNFQVLSWVRS
jgi:hypothetical protein